MVEKLLILIFKVKFEQTSNDIKVRIVMMTKRDEKALLCLFTIKED